MPCACCSAVPAKADRPADLTVDPPISEVFSSITAYWPASAAASSAAQPARPEPRTSTPTRSGSSVS